MMMTITTTCPFCGRSTDVLVDEVEYGCWLEGMSIQDAMPDLSPDEREMLISGICPNCWEQMFGSDEDEESDEEFEDEDDEWFDEGSSLEDYCDLDMGFDPYEGCYTFDC